MRSARLSIMASTAVALIMTAAASNAAPRGALDAFAQMPSPSDQQQRYVRPGSTQKPSTAVDERAMHGRRVSVPPSNANARAPSPEYRDADAPANTAPANLAPPTAPAGAYRLSEPTRASAAPRDLPVAAPIASPPVAAAPEPAMTSPVNEPKPRVSAAPATPGIADNLVSDKLREFIANKQNIERVLPRKNERDAVIALYQKDRNFAPIWVAGGNESDRARDAAAYLKTIDADGLDPRDYALPRLSASSAEGLAEAELKFTATMLTYARHALNGRVAFSRVSPNIDYKDKLDALDVMKQIASTTDMSRTLDRLNPQQPGYKALKAKYAELRNDASAEAGPAPIAHGQLLRYSRDRNGRELIMSDPRVPEIRERLGLPAPTGDANRYDKAMAEAVAKYQKAHGIKPDGQLGNSVIEAMNPPSRAKKLTAILATMERWRWMPRDLGTTHVMLNIPDYYLHLMNNGAQVWQTKVVVGKQGHETPLLTETMKFITLNPTWNVPESIIYNELLPIYETSDPQIFERQGLKMERSADGGIRVYQPPSERNALGQIRFNFPNKFLVYQHDTPEKNYFNPERRDYSHGCMRVQDPLKYAELLLSFASPKSGYTAESIKKMLGGEEKEKQLDFKTQIPVHITYQTAFVDDSGKLQFRDDIYGLDSKLMSILGSERQVADVAVERPANPNFQPTPEQRQKLHSAAGGGSPFGLFEQLFR